MMKARASRYLYDKFVQDRGQRGLGKRLKHSQLEIRVMRAGHARRLHSHVVRELGTRIAVGDLRPGDVLPREETLAEPMEVSRTALREALKVLSAKGLMVARP